MTKKNTIDAVAQQERANDNGSSASLQIEAEEEEETEEEYQAAMQHRRMRQDPLVVRRQVLLRYFMLSSLAVIMALTCPQSFLWEDSSGTLVRPFFVGRLLLVYLVTLAFLTLALQGSNPGYLTPTVMQQLDDWEKQQEKNQQDNKTSQAYSTAVIEDDDKKQQGKDYIDAESPASLPASSSFSATNDAAGQDRLALLENNTSNDQSALLLLRPTRRPPCRHCPPMPPPPLRSHHCHKCGNHVATFDHHCDFIGTCIGEANHARFWVFLTLQGYGFVMCTAAVTSSPVGVLDALLSSSTTHHYHHHNAVAWTTVVYVIVTRAYIYPLAVGASIMWLFHTFLACTNSTTMEFAKGPRHLEYLHPQTRMCDLPFSDRLDRNVYRWLRRDAIWRGNTDDSSSSSSLWRPTVWRRPGAVNHDSEKWWENPWQNKYWSCC